MGSFTDWPPGEPVYRPRTLPKTGFPIQICQLTHRTTKSLDDLLFHMSQGTHDPQSAWEVQVTTGQRILPRGTPILRCWGHVNHITCRTHLGATQACPLRSESPTPVQSLCHLILGAKSVICHQTLGTLKTLI